MLFLIYKQKKAKIEGQDIFHITKNGKTEIHVEPPTQLGLFEIKKIKHALQAMGFKIHLYNLDPKTTFTTQKYNSNDRTPVFVCENVIPVETGIQ